jgi:hypothetical protein
MFPKNDMMNPDLFAKWELGRGSQAVSPADQELPPVTSRGWLLLVLVVILVTPLVAQKPLELSR